MWHRTGAYCIPKLIFSHNFPVKVGDAYYIRVHIVFEFLRYSFTALFGTDCVYLVFNSNSLLVLNLGSRFSSVKLLTNMTQLPPAHLKLWPYGAVQVTNDNDKLQWFVCVAQR